MKRSIIIITGIITAILVLTAGTAQLTLRNDPHCDLSGTIQCEEAKKEQGTITFALTSPETLKDVRITTISNCGQQTTFLTEVPPGPLTVKIECQDGPRVVQGDLTIIYTQEDRRQAQSGTFATA